MSRNMLYTTYNCTTLRLLSVNYEQYFNESKDYIVAGTKEAKNSQRSINLALSASVGNHFHLLQASQRYSNCGGALENCS